MGVANKASVVVVTYRRLDTLDAILRAWLKQSDDVWLADGSGKYKTDLPINLVQFTPDPGNRIRHAVALMTTGDYVIKADDDVVPMPGLADDLVTYCAELDSIVGIHGREFQTDEYYGGTACYSARQINIPVRVDFAGIITCSPRRWLPFDLRECDSPIEDVYWQMGCWPDVDKYVIPTNKYTNLPTAEDSECLFYNAPARVQRTEYCRDWYRKNHK